MYPELLIILLVDLNKPGMCKLQYLTHQTSMAIKKSVALLNGKDLFVFGSVEVEDDALSRELGEVYGEEAMSEENGR